MKAQDLKNSILQLAIQGKLVEQRAEEGTAAELIEQIKAEKKSLIKEKKIKKEEILTELKDSEIPFDIPTNWKWIKLGEVVSVNGGKRIPAGRSLTDVDTGFKYIRVADMKNGTILLDEIKYIPQDIYPKIKNYTILKEDIYITVAGTIGQVGLVPKELDNANLTENADKLVIYLNYKNFMYYMLNSNFIQYQIKEHTTKVGQPKLAIKRIKELIIALPPLEEQKRIVAKIEELMPYVDKYDVAYSEVEKLNKKFPEDMQKSILQYAIQGKLVAQRKEDGTAEELYQQIQEEKKKLIEEDKIKKTKALPEITEDEIPFDIPENWKWVRLGKVASKITDGSHNPPPKKGSGYYVISAKNVKNGKIVFDNVDRYTDENGFLKENSRTNIKRGDIIMGIIGGSIGNIAIYDHDDKVIAQRSIAIIDTLVSNNYIKTVLQSPFIQHQLKNTSSTAQGGVYLGTINELVIPMPPLSEQKRIVAEIKEILPYTNKLVK